MSFQCTVLSPDQQVLAQEVTQVILPAHDGLMGILTDRSPVIVKLGIGPLRLDAADGKKHFYIVDGGLAQMKQNSLTIITSNVTPASEVDHQAAIDEYNAALARKATTPSEIEERDKALNLARVKRSVSSTQPQ